MAGQLVYAHFSSPRDRGASEWMLRSIDVLTVVAPGMSLPDPLGQDPLVGWRLVGHNNRELARSCGFHADEPAARAETAALIGARERLVATLVAVPRQRGVGWCFLLEDAPLAMSARRYENRATARSSAALVLGILAGWPRYAWADRHR